MRILFYLPVVTSWWFEEIIGPMLRGLHDAAELHIIVAPSWNNTGLTAEDAAALADLDRLNWHIVDADNPAQFRFEGAAVDGLLDLVHQIAPDLTLARSADIKTPALFPGTVRYIMEGTADPFHTPMGWVILEEKPFSHGAMPPAEPAHIRQCLEAITPTWRAIETKHGAITPDAIRRQFGLPLDRPVLAVPLQYDHPENFFGYDSPFQLGTQLINDLLDILDDRIFIAATDHPLNDQTPRLNPLTNLAAIVPDRLALCRVDPSTGTNASHMLARAADAMLVDKSKCIALAAFFGMPIVQVGDSSVADWMNASGIDDVTPERLAHRGLPAPDRDAARRWFACHFGIRLLDPKATTLDALLKRVAGTSAAHSIHTRFDAIAPWLKAAA